MGSEREARRARPAWVVASWSARAWGVLNVDAVVDEVNDWVHQVCGDMRADFCMLAEVGAGARGDGGNCRRRRAIGCSSTRSVAGIARSPCAATRVRHRGDAPCEALDRGRAPTRRREAHARQHADRLGRRRRACARGRRHLCMGRRSSGPPSSKHSGAGRRFGHLPRRGHGRAAFRHHRSGSGSTSGSAQPHCGGIANASTASSREKGPWELKILATAMRSDHRPLLLLPRPGRPEIKIAQKRDAGHRHVKTCGRTSNIMARAAHHEKAAHEEPTWSHHDG